MSAAVILVSAVGKAGGSKAAAAALACAGSDPDRPGLLIDAGGRPPRPTLVASTGARALEERLAVHLPGLRAASRGQTCHLAVPGDPSAFGSIRAALPLVRDAVAVVHLSPSLLRDAVEGPEFGATGVLLHADLDSDRALAALAVKDLIGHGLAVRVPRRPLAWVSARRALFGALPAGSPGGLSRSVESLLESQISVEHLCYGDLDDSEPDSEGASQQERRDHARARQGRGFHRHAERQAGR